jgi:hypothetical protein
MRVEANFSFDLIVFAVRGVDFLINDPVVRKYEYAELRGDYYTVSFLAPTWGIGDTLELGQRVFDGTSNQLGKFALLSALIMRSDSIVFLGLEYY